jgi:putative transposase
MPHSYSCNWQHIVFSTKERRKLLRPELHAELWLWPYVAAIAKNHKMQPLAIGGIEDHIHLLVSIPSTKHIAKAVQELKSNSSSWISSRVRGFSWQEGYAAFSVSRSNLAAVSRYIGTQREHHRKLTFEQEFIALLKNTAWSTIQNSFLDDDVPRLRRSARWSTCFPALPCWAKLCRAYGAHPPAE